MTSNNGTNKGNTSGTNLMWHFSKDVLQFGDELERMRGNDTVIVITGQQKHGRILSTILKKIKYENLRYLEDFGL